MNDTLTRRRLGARQFARTAGLAGIAANVLLAVFFASGEAWRSVPGTFAWSGPVNDVLVAIQFAALVPVAVAVRAPLAARAFGLAAMTGVVVLQALLLAGALDFETQVWWVVGCFVVVFVWILAVSTTHLPRTVARAGTVIGAAYLAGALLVWGALALPSESPAQYAVGGLGLVAGLVGWLGLPVWCLMLARTPR